MVYAAAYVGMVCPAAGERAADVRAAPNESWVAAPSGAAYAEEWVMSRSLAIAFICSLGLAAFSAGCSKEDEGPGGTNGMAGTSGGATNPQAGAGAGANGGTSGAGAVGGDSGAGGTPTGGGGGTVSGGAGGMTGGAGGTTGGAGGSGGTPGGGNQWTHLGYDQSNTYFNPSETTITVENAPMLVEKWSFPTAQAPHGGVTIAEGKVFAATLGGTYAINLGDGMMVWHKPELVSDGTAVYADGAIYVHTQGAILHKVNAADGAPVWTSEKTYDLAGCDGTSSPVVAGGKVLVGHSCGPNEVSVGANAMNYGGVEAFDVESGERAWSYNTCEGTEDGAMVWSTVTVDVQAGVVFAATGNNYSVGGMNSDSIHAIGLDDGVRVWRRQVRTGDTWGILGGGGLDTDFGANPILTTIGDRQIVAAGDKGSAFWALDRMTGEIIWDVPDLSAAHTAQNGGVLNNGATDGERFYVSANEPPGAMKLHALNVADGTPAWSKDFPKVTWGMPSVANGVLFVPVNDTLKVFNAATGEELNSFETGGSMAAGAPAIAEGMVVVKSGMQYVFGGADAILNTQVRAYGLP